MPELRKAAKLSGDTGKDAQTFERFRQARGKVKESDSPITALAEKMARSNAA